MAELSDVRRAVSHGDWQLALDLLDCLGAGSRTPEGLELRAHAAYGNGEFEASVTAWEELHSLLVHEGDVAGGARAAAMVAMYLMMDTGLMAPVRGWLTRAERMLVGEPDAPARALIAVVRAYERFMCGDMDAAGEQSARAIELGERLDVQPAVVIGRTCAARVRIFDGQLDEGLDLLDEVGALLMSGQVDHLTTGMMYCELICAAQGLGLHGRATEWTNVMEHWRHGAASGGINGRCRVHRAEMLRVSGPCDLAEQEALQACAELRPWMRREFGWPLAELGNIRLRRGDLAGAEEAFTTAHEHAWSPQPGLALLRLAQGNVAAASALIAEAIVHPFDIPSKERPPFGDLRLAPLLDAQSEIACEGGDLDTARSAADALEAIAASYPSLSLEASVALARSRAALLSGNLDEALECSLRSVGSWADVGAPYEAAGARVVAGMAYHAQGNAECARLEWQAAHDGYVDFGAVVKAERVADLLSSGLFSSALSARRSPGGSSSVGIFRRSGDMRVVAFAGATVHVRDLQGFRFLERLISDPGREFHVLDLVAVEHGTLPMARAVGDPELVETDQIGGGLAVIDEAARLAYQRRLAEVDEDIEEATRTNDLGRVELAQHDREYLINELRSAVGLGGRERSTGGSAERARSSVTRSLRYALKRLAEHHATAAGHLDQSVHTGTYCRYSPDPMSPVRWECG